MNPTNKNISGFYCEPRGHHQDARGIPRDLLHKYEFDEQELITQYIVNENRERKRLDATSKSKLEFENLLKDWTKATGHLSYVAHKITHRNYLRIIGMGERVLPFILADLQKRPTRNWFPALEAISGKRVAEHARSIDEAIKSWLEWGKQNHFC